MAHLNYSKIESEKDWTAKANSLAKRGNTHKKDFARFVGASLAYFYDEKGGNKNVSILNGLLDIAYSGDGLNTSALIRYIGHIVPHTVTKDRENGKRKVFTGKRKGENYPSLIEVDVFIAANPLWYMWKKPKAEKVETEKVETEKDESVKDSIVPEKGESVPETATIVSAGGDSIALSTSEYDELMSHLATIRSKVAVAA